jgi:Uma2 family endonuclease
MEPARRSSALASRAAEGRLTAEDFSRLPGGTQRRELVRGQVVEVSPTAWAHGDAAGELLTRMRAHARRHDLGAVLPEVGFLLARDPDTVRGPDVAFVARARIPDPLPERGFVELAPDLVAEVVSPGDAYSEVQAKVEEYLAAGVREVWVVDPRRRRVEVHAAGRAARTLGPADALATDLLPGLVIPVGEVVGERG